MTRQELENKTVNELCEICKENKLTYYTHNKKLTKAEIIEKILIYQDDMEDIQKKINESAVVEESEKNIFVVNNANKSHYIETIQIGTLVAFREPETNKLNTAKVVNKNSSKKKLKLQTQYGAEFVVSYESIAWVKTGTRWPRGIYDELKGIKHEQ